jgi:hypothetical protein
MTDKARPHPESLDELVAQHHAIELRLAELDRHLALTAEEQLERARLKKLKLQTKDRMARRG